MGSIILPINPIYVGRILNGTKKYEYRKRLCKKDIDTILIYETNPVKKIVAEVEVLGKRKEEKHKLWQDTMSLSGIEEEKYYKYFSKNEHACAYELGNVTRYEKAKELSEYGINFYPQSYVYID